MEFLTRSASVRARVRLWRAAGARVALVPTAGGLHKGHMSLVAEAQEHAGHVIVSIVPNPAEGEAHTLEADRELLQKVGASVAFAPPLQEIYPLGRDAAAAVSAPALPDVPETARRPEGLTHAATLFTKLFNLIQPDIAVFGERDLQQLVMVRRLIEEFFWSIEVLGCPVWRDSDGLAVATSNRQLTAEERAVAPHLYGALSEIAASIDAGARDFGELERRGMASLAGAGMAPEYFAIRQAADLAVVGSGARDLAILCAARLNAHRLVDNLRVRIIDRY